MFQKGNCISEQAKYMFSQAKCIFVQADLMFYIG
jgi:hypothetical protein